MNRRAQQYNVAVVGASGAVGREMVETLEQRKFPVKNLKLLASERSAGSRVEYNGKEHVVRKLSADEFDGVDIALFSAGATVSKEYGPIAATKGVMVIDNSSAWRMDPDILLIVPEVNASVLRNKISKISPEEGLIIANPNCSTIQLVVALQPMQNLAGLKRVVVSTYQSVSGAGKKGMDELWNQCLAIFNQQEIVVKHMPHQIAFTCIPQIDVFLENGYTKEEMKVINETRKIMGLPDLRITATAVRVPVFVCHSESVNVEFEKDVSLSDLTAVLRESPGIIIQDDPENKDYPLNSKLVGTDATYIGRIRRDESVSCGYNFWVVADNLRKGAALNAVQIAEILIDNTFNR